MSKLTDCLEDPRWRLNHLYNIVDKKGRKIIFGENVFQQRLNDLRAQGIRKMKILKSRQVGCSTNELLAQADMAMWTPNFNAFIMADCRENIKKLFQIPRHAHQYMDPRVRPELDRGGGSMYEMRFPKLNSKIRCGLESRGEAIQWLHISEAAFIQDPLMILDTIETVPVETGIITWESTPNGMGNLFYDSWQVDDDYSRIFFPWYLFPEYQITNHAVTSISNEEKELCIRAKREFGVVITKGQIAWRRMKKLEQGNNFIRNYPEDDISCFLVGANQPIDLLKLKEILDKVPAPIKTESDWLKIWEHKKNNALYVIGADTAEGVEGDFSVGAVWDAKARRQVAQIRHDQWKPGDFAQKLYDLAKLYTHGNGRAPLMAVERNNHGHAVLLKLDETLRYPNLYKTPDEKLGWRTDMVTRPIMIDTFIEGVEHETVCIVDRETIKEMQTLVNSGGRIEAATGKHDDCVIANAIAVQMCLELGGSAAYTDIETKLRV